MKGMSTIVKTIARFLAAFIFLFGAYIIVHGHLTPGGGFAGGVILSGSFILLFLAFGSEESKNHLKKFIASLAESTGLLIFWVVSMLGIFLGRVYFLNVLPKGEPFRIVSAGSIPLGNIAIGIEVAAALFAIFITLSVLKVGEKK